MNWQYNEQNLAIESAEWLSENEWVKRKHTHPNRIGHYYSHKHCEYKKIEELFNLFVDFKVTNTAAVAK